MAESIGSGTIRWITSIGTGLLMAAGPVFAATHSLSGGIDNRFSDNALLVSTGEQSDTETRVNLNLQYLSDPGQCSSAADMGLAYGYWHNNVEDSEFYTNGTLHGQCELAKGLLWQASDTIKQVPQDTQEADTRDNRTRKNVFSTGPVYTLQLTQVDQLQFSAAYENTEFEEPEEPDSERVTSTASYNHNFSDTLQGGLSLSAERAELDTEEELDRESAVVTFSKAWATTQVSGSLGVNRLETRLGIRKVSSDAVTGTFNLVRDIDPTSELTFSATRRLTDLTSTLDLQFSDFNFDLTQTSAAEITVLQAGYSTQFSQGSTFRARISANRSDYVDSGERQENRNVSLRYSQPVTGLLSWYTNAGYQHQRYEDEGSKGEIFSGSVGLDYRLSARMDVRAAIGRREKTRDIELREYVENWVVVSLDYRFF
ncbi:hypothetical protein [Marinobacter sp. F3R08]|uniref:hypothetical protein n=1 Tax=Marinobacter sp. F3R08 TaxID=2841559 RepID=UPI001C096BAE|nr:hypothetical protein [Marinobacter sp. F3R08]MBU2955599.1 hypothetical protein [Marinobacter sp. F3R08]